MSERLKDLVDREVEKFYYRHAEGVRVGVLDIPKIFEEGREAFAAGRDLEAAVKASIAAYRLN